MQLGQVGVFISTKRFEHHYYTNCYHTAPLEFSTTMRVQKSGRIFTRGFTAGLHGCTARGWMEWRDDGGGGGAGTLDGSGGGAGGGGTGSGVGGSGVGGATSLVGGLMMLTSATSHSLGITQTSLFTTLLNCTLKKID